MEGEADERRGVTIKGGRGGLPFRIREQVCSLVYKPVRFIFWPDVDSPLKTSVRKYSRESSATPIRDKLQDLLGLSFGREVMNRNAKLVQILMLVAVFTTLLELGSGQVTFSNGWKPGKRTYDTGNCRLSSKSVGSICQLLLTELKQLAVCEARAVLRYLQPEEDTLSNQMLFSGGR